MHLSRKWLIVERTGVNFALSEDSKAFMGYFDPVLFSVIWGYLVHMQISRVHDFLKATSHAVINFLQANFTWILSDSARES